MLYPINFVIVLIILAFSLCCAEEFKATGTIGVYFSRRGGATEAIVKEISITQQRALLKLGDKQLMIEVKEILAKAREARAAMKGDVPVEVKAPVPAVRVKPQVPAKIVKAPVPMKTEKAPVPAKIEKTKSPDKTKKPVNAKL